MKVDVGPHRETPIDGSISAKDSTSFKTQMSSPRAHIQSPPPPGLSMPPREVNLVYGPTTNPPSPLEDESVAKEAKRSPVQQDCSITPPRIPVVSVTNSMVSASTIGSSVPPHKGDVGDQTPETQHRTSTSSQPSNEKFFKKPKDENASHTSKSSTSSVVSLHEVKEITHHGEEDGVVWLRLRFDNDDEEDMSLQAAVSKSQAGFLHLLGEVSSDEGGLFYYADGWKPYLKAFRKRCEEYNLEIEAGPEIDEDNDSSYADESEN